jgi:hypothetical protein
VAHPQNERFLPSPNGLGGEREEPAVVPRSRLARISSGDGPAEGAAAGQAPHGRRVAPEGGSDPLPLGGVQGRSGEIGDPALLYDEEQDLFRFRDGRFAFSREWADWPLLRKRGRMVEEL